MAKKKTAKKVNNGLTEAILGFNPNSLGPQVQQVDTLFKNNRWYMISNMRQLLSQIYVEHGLVQTIVDVPVDDGLRGGVEVKTKQLSEDEIDLLLTEMEREEDLRIVGQALKWNRLFGGAGVVIITDQDPSTPLNLAAITEDSPLEFRAVDMWELFWSKQNTSDYSAVIDSNEFQDVEFYDYYGKKLHKSRVLKMKGLTAPSFIRPRLRGWGFSVVETLARSINQYLKSTELLFEVIDEFKIDVYKIKNLTNTLLQPSGTQKIQNRIQLANQQKNFQNAIVMDGEDDYVAKELTFGGIAETMAGIRMQIASDMRMPLTKIFGISAAGFSSGEDDIENYNAMVESQVRQKSKFDILRLVEIRCQKLFGYVPDDLKIEFKPLRILSAEQEENVKTQKFNRVLAAKTAGEIDSFEFREACNRGNLLEIKLDTDDATIGKIESEKEAKAEADAASVPEGKGGKSATEAPVAKNSLDYDVAAYEVDGGDRQFDDWRERQVDRLEDKSLVAKAKEASMRAFKKIKWQFVVWYYRQHGGKI